MAGEEQVIANLQRWYRDMDSKLDAIAEHQAAQGEQDMKAQAPWRDRTGNARNSLSGSTEISPTHKVIFLSGGMPYSRQLELDFQGRYAVIVPVRNQVASRIVGLLDGLRS